MIVLEWRISTASTRPGRATYSALVSKSSLDVKWMRKLDVMRATSLDNLITESENILTPKAVQINAVK